MRLRIHCDHCNYPTYLNIVADSRQALARRIGSTYFTINCCYCGISQTHSVNGVVAEVGDSTVPVGAIIGGILGAVVGGPIGILVGGGAGVVFGGGLDTRERERVNRFNREVV